MERLIHTLLVLTLCGLAAVFLAACDGTRSPIFGGDHHHSDEPRYVPPPIVDPERRSYPNSPWQVAPSLEEQIYDALSSDSLVVVMASLLSATAGIETVPGDGEGATATYRPVHELRFTVREYLEGSGPNEILVVVRGDETHPTEASALREATSTLSSRNTSWDNRQAVLFVGLADTIRGLSGDSGATETSSSRRAAFSRSNPLESAWDYTVDNLSRAWLPGQATAAGATGQPADPSFITDGAQAPPPTISLADLKAKIAGMKAELKAGEGIKGFEECISGRILRERFYRANPFSPPILTKTLSSGSAAGTEVYKGKNNYHQEPNYNNYWLSGRDAALFQAAIIDDDSAAANGYEHTLASARPLPTGGYIVHYNIRHYSAIPCNFKPNDAYSEHVVAVTSPAGTLHEAFFDPVAMGAAVGADGTNGVLKPTAFSVGVRTTASLVKITWVSGQVTMEFDPSISLAGYHADFITLDGSVSLRLDFDDASETVDGTKRTLTWTVAAQPWQDGDKLMLRIRDASAPTPAP